MCGILICKFLHQNVKDFVHKNFNAFTDSGNLVTLCVLGWGLGSVLEWYPICRVDWLVSSVDSLL